MSGTRARRLAAVLVAWLLVSHSEAGAGSFGILPVQIFLSARSPGSVLTLKNDDSQPLRLQLAGYVWDQDVRGEARLTPTADIVIFPRLLTVAPGEVRKVRVGTTLRAAGSERTYRLIVQELGPVATPGDDRGIQMRARLSIPVFVQPATPVAKALIESLVAAPDRLVFTLRNAGNLHVQPLAARIRDRKGGEIWTARLPLGYVLAGGVREFMVPLSSNRCAELMSGVFEVEMRQGTVLRQMPAPPVTCGG